MDRPDVSFEILGGLRVRARGRVLEMSRPVAAAALAALLLTPGLPVGTERLIDLVWGPAGSSRGAVHMTISRLRKWLAESAGLDDGVVSTGTGYLLNVPEESVDASRFTALADAALREPDLDERFNVLRTALALWHGPAVGSAGDSFHDDPVVARLERRRVGCAHELTGLALELGRPGAALVPLQELAADLPFDEAVHAGLITLLGASGRRADGLRVYERVRARLADELGVDPSALLRGAHADLLRGKTHPRPQPPDPPLPQTPGPSGSQAPDPSRWQAPGPSGSQAPGPSGSQVPGPSGSRPGGVCQLPTDVPDFTGRASELDALRRGVRPGDGTAPAVWALVGHGGAGKSALAVHAAHGLREVFGDGQLYADLGGLGTRPASPAEVLTRFLRALDVGEHHIPERLEARAELYRARLAGRRILVVLDNAAGQAQVTPLLPGSPGCGVIITSRAGLSGIAGVRQIRVRDPDEDQALELLRRLVGPERLAGEPQAARELVRLCERLPLAIRIVAARLIDQPQSRVARLVERMADPAHRLRVLEYGQLSVRASLALSYRRLAEPAARLLRGLGWLTAPVVPVWVGALLLDATVREARESFEDLVDAQLIDTVADAHPGCPQYRTRDLVRLYARERAAADEPQRNLTATVRRAETALALHRAPLLPRTASPM
ncbi:BTAD domain-containing putative transcriptional regulator [Actinomadura sp. 9N215]|uniref:AfsR/SARP family transcriptional regulator n=1 Tax=Actinomadura sp. 9N215 TaxID=3375150 RepID=UPI0037971A8E